MRAKAAAHINKKSVIEWRSHDPSRLETFSDAVFAFALTLIIVSIEVPKSFDELFETMKGTLSFAACFGMLFLIWNSQNVFFRRYGLNDNTTVLLNAILLFVVLVYVYPMKFLAILLFTNHNYVHDGQILQIVMKEGQSTTLLLIYGLGYSVIYALFYLMYKNANRRATQLELTPREIFETKTISTINLVSVLIGVLAMVMAIILPTEYSGLSGFIYFLIPISYTIWFRYRGKKGREKFPISN